MRNLKKTLCLFLALVFVLGLCTVGAADIVFNDEQSIQYKEAVQTMAGLGILNGYEDGSFKPKQNLTRAEAAKIIAYVAGGEGVENGAAEQIFDDVPTSHWANKYISYCYRKNIINGVGANKFDPNGLVTRNAVMKMLLAACGYGSQGEFTGANWESEVFDKATETKILQGFKASDWSGAATREEMAHLAYNTLMTVAQVAYSQNTGSYEPKYVNGSYNVTLANQPWGIHTDEGVVTANRATGANKGTILDAIIDGTTVQKYYLTEEDENPAILGHQIRITYRLETSGGAQVARAFFLEDQCTEVKGKDAVMINNAKSVFTFNNGKLVSYNVPDRAVRDKAPGTFVLNADGLVVSYKTEGYFISTLSVNLLTMQTTVYDPTANPPTYVPVQAPAGAVSGDLVTVYHIGDTYTAKLCPRTTGVYIEQRGRDAEGNITYNNGTIYPSKAENLVYVSLPLNITPLNNTNLMELGSRYTLYFDDQGGCIGFSDRASSGSLIGAENYGLLVCTYMREKAGTWGEDMYYAQVILGNGTTVDAMPISQTTYASGLTPNTVYKVGSYGSQYILSLPTNGEVATEYYANTNPLTDYSSAVRIQYNGKIGGELRTSVNQSMPKNNTPVIYVFDTEITGYYNVRRVKAAWFMEGGSSVTPVVNDDYIYIADTMGQSWTVNGTAYEAYKNGAAMTDLYLSAAPSSIGFVTATRGSNGIYSIKSYVPAGNGTSTGVRSETLNIENYKTLMIDNSTLYLMDASGQWQSLSLKNVVVNTVGAAAIATISIKSVDDLWYYAKNGVKITFTLVENVASNGVHSVAGNAIYVTGIAG